METLGGHGGEAPQDSDVVVLRTGRRAEVVVRGEVDLATTPAFDAALEQVLEAGATELVVGLGDVTFMGSSGLGLLLRAQRLMADRGGRLVLADVSPAVADVLSMTGLSERFGVAEPGDGSGLASR